jgi:VanZ family protein
MNIKIGILRWLPAVTLMLVIFGFSSIPSREMPHLGQWDYIFKKGAHMLGYALLALAYWYGLGLKAHRWWVALTLALIYAISDEYHQSFVPGRQPSWVDALVIDGSGAALMVFAISVLQKRKR